MTNARNLSPWEHFVRSMRDVETVDGCPVDDAAALPAWRERFRQRFESLLGPMPSPVPLNAEVTASEDCGAYRRDHVVFDSERHMSVPAFLLVPHDRDAPGPAILAQHGHGPGKDEVCGIDGGDAERRAIIDGHNGDYAHQLALLGYVVLAPDLRTFGERRDVGPPDRYGCDLTHVHMSMLGHNLLTLDMWDLARAIDHLASHPLVDPDRIGMVGLSQGGTMTLFMAAWDERIKAAVVSGYFANWSTSATIPWNMCGSQVLHGMLGQMEHVDLGALVAPRPMLIESGTADPIFPAPVAVHEWSRLAKVYAALGAADRLWLDPFEGGHQWHGVQAQKFLAKWL